MNRQAIRNKMYRLITEAESNTKFGPTEANLFIAEGYEFVCFYNAMPWEWLITRGIVTNVYTEVSAESTGSALEVASASGIVAGLQLYVTDGVVYEEVEVDSVLGTSVTLVSPGLAGTYEAGDAVIGNCVQLPADFDRLLNVRAEKIEDGRQEIVKMMKVGEDRVDEEFPVLSTEGTPEYYVQRGRLMYVYPLPDGVWRYRLKYYRIPDELTDTTEPLFPERFHEMLAYFAAAKLMAADANTRNPMVIQQYMAEFNNKLQQMMNQMWHRPDDRPRFRLPSEMT